MPRISSPLRFVHEYLSADQKSIAKVLIIPMQEDKAFAIEVANSLRKNKINTEIYLNDKKLKAKLKYADKLNIPYIIIIGEDEIKTKLIKLKNMETGIEKEIKFEENIEWNKIF